MAEKLSAPLNILAFDTSSDICSVSLLKGTELFDELEQAPRMHAQLLLPMISSVLSRADLSVDNLDAIAFGCGPGSFTGLRISTGVAQGLSYGSDLPVIPVSSLQALAFRSFCEQSHEYTLSTLDARMDEVYWSVFRRPDALSEFHCDSVSGFCSELLKLNPEQLIPERLGEEQVCAPEQILKHPNDSQIEGDYQCVLNSECQIVGSGSAFKERFPAEISHISHNKELTAPSAPEVALLAYGLYHQPQNLLAAASAQPTYLRNDVAWNKLPGR